MSLSIQLQKDFEKFTGIYWKGKFECTHTDLKTGVLTSFNVSLDDLKIVLGVVCEHPILPLDEDLGCRPILSCLKSITS